MLMDAVKKARDCKARQAFFSDGCKIRLRFKRFVDLLGDLYKIDLPFPNANSLTCVSDLKKFCGELLEGGPHLWRRSISRLSIDNRKELAMSLFLFRKALPSEEPDVQAYIDRMSEESSLPDGGFLRFVQREVGKMFPYGWDKPYYQSAALNSVLPIKATNRTPRARGGARTEGLVEGSGSGWRSHAEYVEKVLACESDLRLSPSRVVAIETAGKHRIVSASCIDMNLLRPLHNSIYNRISRFDWLLRGDAKASSFSSFSLKDGEVFVSGDYESATDNLNLHVQRVILQRIVGRSTMVPLGIKQLALSSQSIDLAGPDGRVTKQRRGQLMGNLLSFPLLCIVNYLGFLYYAGKGYPVKINGDDIVFRAPRSVADRWMKGVSGSGLTLSMGKTMVDRRYFTLNSTLFKGCIKGARRLRVVRATTLGLKPDIDAWSSVAGRWRQLVKDFRSSRGRTVILATHFIRINMGLILSQNRSLTRGLSINFPPEAIVSCGLWARECFYLSLPVEFPLPLTPCQRAKMRIPPGWEMRRVESLTKEIKDKQKEIGPEFVSLAWTLGEEDLGEGHWQAWKDRVKTTGSTYRPCPRGRLRKQSRLLGVSVQNAKRYLKPGIFLDVEEDGIKINRRVTNPHVVLRVSRPSGHKVWLPSGYVTDNPVNNEGVPVEESTRSFLDWWKGRERAQLAEEEEDTADLRVSFQSRYQYLTGGYKVPPPLVY